jgi:hypothetical protein
MNLKTIYQEQHKLTSIKEHLINDVTTIYQEVEVLKGNIEYTKNTLKDREAYKELNKTDKKAYLSDNLKPLRLELSSYQSLKEVYLLDIGLIDDKKSDLGLLKDLSIKPKNKKDIRPYKGLNPYILGH